jgi:YggT family protein
VNLLLCDVAKAALYVVNVYTFLLFVYAVLSWVPELRRGRWAYYLARIIEPVLVPVRRIVPPLGGLDLAFLIVVLVLQLLVRPGLQSLVFNSCIAIF